MCGWEGTRGGVYFGIDNPKLSWARLRMVHCIQRFVTMSKIASLRWISRRPHHLPTKVNSKRIDDEIGVPYWSYTLTPMGRVGHAIAFAYGDRYTAVEIQDQAISGGEKGRLDARKILVKVCKEHVPIHLRR
jgi:hypothetical protein